MGQIKKLYQDSGNVETTVSTETNAVYPVTASSATYHPSSWGALGSNQTVGSILGALDQGYQYIGVASPSTSPISATHKIFYLASEEGTYSGFGGISVSGLTVLKNSGSGWSKEELHITSGGGGGGGGGTVTGYIGTTQVQSSAGAQNLTGISNLYIGAGGKIYFGSGTDTYIEYGANGFHFSKALYSDYQVSAGGIGSGGGGGGGGSTVSISNLLPSGTRIATLRIDGIDYDILAPSGGGGSTYSAGTGIDITSNTISLKKATANSLGGVIPGTGLSINANGVLSVTGGGGGGGGTLTDVTLGGVSVVSGTVAVLPAYPDQLPASDVYPWAKASTKPSYNFSEIGSKPTTLSGYGITDAKIQSGVITLGSNTITPLTSHQTIYALTLQAGTFANGTYTPNSAAKTFNIPTTLDHISDGTNRKLSDYVTLHTTQNNIDGEKTFTTKPVHIDSTSGLDVNSYIDIGNARLVYDSGANALHITKKSGAGAATIGLFADGFVASGGVAGQSTTSYVDLESDQTVGGDKIFTGATLFNGAVTFNSNQYALTIDNDEINFAGRLYIQYNNEDVCLTRGGKTIIGAYPGSTAIGSNKLYVDGNACFAKIIDTGYSSGHVVSIQDIVNRIINLEGRL